MKSKFDMLGRTMWETIAAMSVVGLITVSVIKMASTVMERYKLSRIGQQVTDLQKAVNFRYMSKGKYNSASLEQMKNDKALPYEVSKGTHAFGGTVEIGGIVAGTETYDQDDDLKNLLVARRYYIKFTAVPLEACMSLADISWVNEGSSSLVATYLGKGCELVDVGEKQPNDKKVPDVKDDCTVSYSTPIEITNVDIGCDEKGTTMIWVFE